MFVVLGSQCTGHVPKLLPGGLGLTSLLGVFVRYIQSAATIGQVEMPQNAPHPAIFARLMNSDPAHIFVTLPDSDSNARQGGKGWAGRVLRWMGADVPLDRSKDSRACLLLHAENSLLQYIYKKAQAAWAGQSMEQLIEELEQIMQFAVLYHPQDEKGPNRVALVLSKETLAQQGLAKELGLDALRGSERE